MHYIVGECCSKLDALNYDGRSDHWHCWVPSLYWAHCYLWRDCPLVYLQQTRAYDWSLYSMVHLLFHGGYIPDRDAYCSCAGQGPRRRSGLLALKVLDEADVPDVRE